MTFEHPTASRGSRRPRLSAWSRAFAVFAALLAAALYVPASAHAQYAVEAEAEPYTPPVDRIRTALRFDLVTRNFNLSNSDGSIQNEAPFYPGARVAVDLFPIAFFARGSAAAGLGFHVEFGKHNASTVTDIGSGDEFVTLEVPTRHDTTSFGLSFEWKPIPQLAIIPQVSWKIHEFALGYNPLFSNAFYRGIDVGAGIRYHVHPLVALQASFGVRPGTSLGSTETVWGESATAFGYGVDGSVRVRAPFGLYGDAGVRYEAYNTRYTPGSSGIPETKSTDGFLSLLLAVGFAY